MANRRRIMTGLSLVVSMAVLAARGGEARAQFGNVMSNPFQSGMSPKFPPSGDWLEIVTVTPKWLVVQNQRGQQFPIAADSVAQFTIRWPIPIDRIAPNALVETTGIDLGSNQIRSDHVDVFQGSARNMVQPIVQRVIGYGRTPTAFDMQNQNNYGVFIHLMPGEDQIPNRLHLVGSIVGTDPLQLSSLGNNAVAVLPAANGLYFSEVTPGSASYLRGGDLVYLVPAGVTPKSMLIQQMVAYKSMPFSQFVP